MKRTLSILAVLALTIGVLTTTTTDNLTQEQEVISCDDCAREKDSRDAIVCDDCAREKDSREALAFCDDCAREKDSRGDRES